MKRLLSLIILIWLVSGFSAATAAPEDLTSSIQVTKSGLVYNRATKTYNTSLTLTNTSPTAISGSIALSVIVNDPNLVSLSNSSGLSSAGYPTVTVAPSNGVLKPGDSLNNVVLSFNNPSQVKFNFSLLINPATAPVFDTTSNYSQQIAVVGAQARIPVTVNSVSDTGNVLISAANLPAGATLSATTKQANGQWAATLQWTPTAAQTGVTAIAFTALDNQEAITSNYTINFTVLNNGNVVNRILGVRPKIMSVGNSINGFNVMSLVDGGEAFGADGHITWIHARTNAAFDRAQSTANIWSDGAGLDNTGCYYFGGAVLNQSGSHSILNHLSQAMSLMLETPDIVYLDNVTENDLGQGYAPAVIEAAIAQAINLVQTQWPNALIIISTPSPSQSYNTATLHANVAAVSAYIKALPNTFNNLLVENNISTILPGTVDQPNPSYVIDVIHPNERGAFVRAKGFVAQYGWLFPNELVIPSTPYNPANPTNSYQFNPVFAYTGGMSQNPANVSGLTTDYNYTSYEFYLGVNNIANLTQIHGGGGLNITLGANGPVVSEAGLVFGSSYGSGYYVGLPQVNPTAAYYSAMKVKVVNPVNLFGFGFHTNFVGGTTYVLTAARFEGAFAGNHPEGLSDLFQAGDTFTFVTPTSAPGAGNIYADDYGFVYGTQYITPGDPTTYPSVQIISQNISN
ncbi:MAG: SGNH/GDSL hydrolase family protein [Methylomonas sp.]|jgi:hypothetical protein